MKPPCVGKAVRIVVGGIWRGKRKQNDRRNRKE